MKSTFRMIAIVAGILLLSILFVRAGLYGQIPPRKPRTVPETEPTSDNFADFVAYHWYYGKKKELFAVAQARLQDAPYDLAALLIVLEYHTGYMNTNEVSLLLPVIGQTTDNIHTPELLKEKEILKLTVETFQNLLPKITKEMEAAERHKGDITHKTFAGDTTLLAMQADGILTPVSKEERDFVSGKIPRLIGHTSPKNKASNQDSHDQSAEARGRGGLVNFNEQNDERPGGNQDGGNFRYVYIAIFFLISGFIIYILINCLRPKLGTGQK